MMKNHIAKSNEFNENENESIIKANHRNFPYYPLDTLCLDISNDCLFIVSCQGGEKLLLH